MSRSHVHECYLHKTLLKRVVSKTPSAFEDQHVSVGVVISMRGYAQSETKKSCGILPTNHEIPRATCRNVPEPWRREGVTRASNSTFLRRLFWGVGFEAYNIIPRISHNYLSDYPASGEELEIAMDDSGRIRRRCGK